MKKILLMLFIMGSITNVAQAQSYGWVALNPPSIPGTPDFSDLYFINDSTGWISCSSTNSVFKTTDGGLTFITQNTTLTTNAIHMVSATEGYCGGASGFVFRTIDGGATWPFRGTITNTLTDISFPPGGGTGYACGFNGTIYSVTSSGVTAMTSGVISHMASISFPFTSNEGWVCGESIIRHFTGGAWVADQVNITGTWNAIYFIDNQNGWAAGDNGKIIHTTDGKNWSTQVNPDLQNRSLFNVFFLNANEGWAAGLDGIILHTTNGGINWYVEANGLTTAFLTGVHFTSSANGYVTGGGKTLLKYTQLSTGVGHELEELKFEIYPNPTAGKFKVQCLKFKVESVELVDLFGKVVASYDWNPASEVMAIDAGRLPGGVYVLRIISEKRFATQKIIIQK